MDDGVPRIAGRKQHSEAWPTSAGLVRQLASIHPAGQADVGKKQRNLRLPPQYLQCRRPARRFGHAVRSEEHTSELQSLMRITYAVFCLNTRQLLKHFCYALLDTQTSPIQTNSSR